ncbi:hypothetical protein [Rhodococcoides yunnanense]|uniref:hypothetical protein n=1 Tax=Rhodococcoides yunnanense TaxID=278209 RepID=UPI00093323B7|nr:hypothetical protein [Rhodococcus yunnanensis]
MTSTFDSYNDDLDTRGYDTIESIIRRGQELYAAMTKVGDAMANFDREFVQQNWTGLCTRSLVTMSFVAQHFRELCHLYTAHPDMDFEHPDVNYSVPDLRSWPDGPTTEQWQPAPGGASDETIKAILRGNTHLCVQQIENCAEIVGDYIDSVGGWYDSEDPDAVVEAFDHNVMHLTMVVVDIAALWRTDIYDAHATVARSMQAPRQPGWERLLEPRAAGSSDRYSE